MLVYQRVIRILRIVYCCILLYTAYSLFGSFEEIDGYPMTGCAPTWMILIVTLPQHLTSWLPSLQVVIAVCLEFCASRIMCNVGIAGETTDVFRCFFSSTNKNLFWIIWFWLLLLVGLNPFASCATEITEILASSQQHTSCDQKIWSDDNCRCFSAKGSLCFLLRESSIAKVIWLPLAYSKWTTRR
jgi:hypothetical protein